MPKYRQKETVEAVQLTKDLALQSLCDRKPGPFGLFVSGTYHPGDRTVQSATVFIATTTGHDRAYIGDWILKYPDGRLVACRDDTFRATYEQVGAADA